MESGQLDFVSSKSEKTFQLKRQSEKAAEYSLIMQVFFVLFFFNFADSLDGICKKEKNSDCAVNESTSVPPGKAH